MSDRFARYGGVDFSGAREPLANLWTAVGCEADGKLRIDSLRPHAFRADLAAFVGEGWRSTTDAPDDASILWGVDFACGIPAAATEHLLGRTGRWPDMLAWMADRPPDEVKESIPDELRTPRLTDAAGGLAPFDMRMYRQTVEGLRWLHELREEHAVAMLPQTANPASRCVLVEVSPSATTADLGLPRRRAPSRPGEYRARAAALRTFLSFGNPEIETLAVILEDAWDAVVTCLTAWMVREDLEQPFRTAGHPREAVELEGWIYRPPAALA